MTTEQVGFSMSPRMRHLSFSCLLTHSHSRSRLISKVWFLLRLPCSCWSIYGTWLHSAFHVDPKHTKPNPEFIPFRTKPSRPLYSRSRKACRKRRNALKKIPTSPSTTCNNILLLLLLQQQLLLVLRHHLLLHHLLPLPSLLLMISLLRPMVPISCQHFLQLSLLPPKATEFSFLRLLNVFLFNSKRTRQITTFCATRATLQLNCCKIGESC